MLSLDQIYIQIGLFIKWAIADAEVTVSRAYQTDNSRAPKPFIIMQIGNFATYGTPAEYDIDDQGIQTISLDKSFNLSLNSFADKAFYAEELLNRVKDRLMTYYARDNFFQGEISPRTVVGGVQPIPAAEGGVNESRAFLEVRFSTTTDITDNVGYIETIISDLYESNEFIKEIIVNE